MRPGPNQFTVQISFVNGSSAVLICGSYLDARSCARNISYSGGRVRRVEVHHPDKSVTAVWDKDWDAVSQHAGLHNE